MISIVADLHTHTIASGHGADTLRTMCEFAIKKGFKGIGITDHGPGLPGGASPIYFMSLRRLANALNPGIRIIRGIEDDIIDTNGNLALNRETREELELILTGLHPLTWISEQSPKTRTVAIINAIINKQIHVLSHPVGISYEFDFRAVAEAAARYHVALEFNGTKIKDKEIHYNFLDVCEKTGASIVVNSDAHAAEEVGLFNHALKIIDETGFPKERIINCSIPSIERFFGINWNGS